MLNTIALILLICIVVFIIYLVIYVHDIPYEIAKERNHPHQDAIHIAGWVSLFLAHAIWPILWIWAYLYKPGEKFLSVDVSSTESRENAEKIKMMEKQIANLTEKLEQFQPRSMPSTETQEV